MKDVKPLPSRTNHEPNVLCLTKMNSRAVPQLFFFLILDPSHPMHRGAFTPGRYGAGTLGRG